MVQGRILQGMLAASLVTGLLAMPGQVKAQLLDEAVWFEREVGAGITWRYYHFEDLFGGPQSITYMMIDLDNPAVELHLNYREAWVGPSPGLDSPLFPRQLTSVFAEEIPGSKVAINGSFFNTSSYNSSNPTAPWGGTTTFLKVDGNIINTNPDNEGGLFFNDTSDVMVSGPVGSWAAMAPNWDNMMINNPLILRDGEIDVGTGGPLAPRTGFGVDQDTNTLFLVVADGRTSGARGMIVHEFAQTMLALGAKDAVNLDGGGSSTMWVAGEPFNGVVNYPSDNGAFDRLGQRRVGNAVVVVSDPGTPGEWDGRLSGAPSYSPFGGSGAPVTVTATYENIGTETWTPDEVSIVPSRPFGRSSDLIPEGEESSFFSMDPATVPPGASTTVTLNLVAPEVAGDTFFTEHFALWHETEGYFGPPDGELHVNTLVQAQGAEPEPGTDHFLFVVGGYTTSASMSDVPDGVDNTLDARVGQQLRSVLVADVDTDAKTVTNWRRAGVLPLQHPDRPADQLGWAYLYNGVSYLNGRIYVGPARTDAAGAVTSNFVAWAEVNPDGSLEPFNTSPILPLTDTGIPGHDTGRQGQSAVAIVEVDDTHYIYVLGGRDTEGGGQTDRIIYAPIDSDTGAVGDWEVASITIPSTDWFNSAIGIDGTLAHFSGAVRGSMSADLIVPQANGDLVGGWNSEVYSTAHTNRWDAGLTNATDPAGDTYVYMIGGRLSDSSPRNRVDYSKFESGETGTWESSTFPVWMARPTAAGANNMIVVPGGSSTEASFAGFGTGTDTVWIGTVANGGAVTWTQASEPMTNARTFHGSIMAPRVEEDPVTSVTDWMLLY